MFVCTGLTAILPDSINYRKPTLREFASAEQAKLEQASVELVEVKSLSPVKDEKESVKSADNVDAPIVVAVSDNEKSVS